MPPNPVELIDDVQNVQTRPESIGPLDGVTQGEIGTARKISRKERVFEVHERRAPTVHEI